MTNAEKYNLTGGFVAAVRQISNNIYIPDVLHCIEMSIEAYRKFCRSHNTCKGCPFFENEEDCFIQWLNMEVRK